MDLGALIRKQLIKYKFSQSQLAKRVHVGQRTISNYVNNRTRPDLETLFKICEILDIDVYSLSDSYKKKDNPFRVKDEHEFELLQIFRRIHPSKKSNIIKLILFFNNID